MKLTNGVIHTIDFSDFDNGNLTASDLSFGDIWLLTQIKKAIYNNIEITISYGYKS